MTPQARGHIETDGTGSTYAPVMDDCPDLGGPAPAWPPPLGLLRPAVLTLVVLSLLTGLAYPLAATGLSELAFSYQARGSLIHADGRVVGSRLIGQPFLDPGYFWGRPSETAPFPYNAGASAASNLAPANSELLERVRARVEALRRSDPAQQDSIPVDLVTASASGLDPHISPAAAQWQAPRVARVRGLDEALVRALVRQYTQGRQLGFLGEPRVNVLELNLALDALG